MDFRYYPYSIPLNDAEQTLDGRIFPGGAMGGPPSGPPSGFPSFPGQQFPGFPPSSQPGGGGQHGGPSSGFPGQQFPGSPPSHSPGGGGQHGGPPSSPPPSFTPQMQQQHGVSAFAVDPGAIRGCLYRFTYVWLQNNRRFWFYPTFVGRNSVSGWRWRNFRWVYYGTDLRRIRNFQCF